MNNEKGKDNWQLFDKPGGLFLARRRQSLRRAKVYSTESASYAVYGHKLAEAIEEDGIVSLHFLCTNSGIIRFRILPFPKKLRIFVQTSNKKSYEIF
jgi:hypothetical protein